MSALTRTHGNRLIQRARRHANLATLFRATGEPVEFPTSSPFPKEPPSLPEIPRVRAFLPGNQPDVPPDRGLVDLPGELQPVPPAEYANPDAISSAEEQPASQPPPAPVREEPVSPPATATQRGPTQATPSTAAPARIRTAAPPPERPSTHPAVSQSSAVSPQVIARRPAESQPPSRAAMPGVDPAPPPTPSPVPAEEKSELDEKDWSRLSTIMRRHQEREAAAAAQPAETASPSPVGELPPASPAATQVLEQPSVQPAPPQPEGNNLTTPPAKTPPVEQSQLPPADEEDTQPLSLEQVWPVALRAPAPPPAAPKAANLQREPVEPIANTVAAPIPLEEQERQAGQISQALQGVSSGQPTGSRIEVIPPRQPRPLPVVTQAPVAQANPPLQREGSGAEPHNPAQLRTSAPPEEVETAIARAESRSDSPAAATYTDVDLGVIQQPPPEITPLDQSTPNQAVQFDRPSGVGILANTTPLPPGETVVTPPGPVQRHPLPVAPETNSSPVEPGSTVPRPSQEVIPQPYKITPAGQPPAPRMVDSEIGPLPADLWTLIGQNPPDLPVKSASPTSPGMKIPSSPVVQRAIQINEVSANVEQPISDSGEGQANDQPAQESETSSGDFQAAGGEDPRSRERSAGENGSQSSGAAQPDLDEIARQVYLELKNRLQVEWERLRHKF